jgi:hypothetical protein
VGGCGGEQKDEPSKLMKEYAKQNKENDMTLASQKKKEDFGSNSTEFEIFCFFSFFNPSK